MHVESCMMMIIRFCKNIFHNETQMVQVVDASNVVRVTDDTTVTVNATVKEEDTTDLPEVTTKDRSDKVDKATEMVKVIDHIDGDKNDEIGGKPKTSTGKVDEVMA